MIDCRSPYTNILSIWNGVDAYVVEADKNLCSSNCPCALTATTFPTTYTAKWIITPAPVGVTNFTACSDSTKMIAYNAAIKIDPRLDTDQSFNAAGFAKAFAYIEKTWECTGWCTTSYTDSLNLPTVLSKYIYNDINL